MTSQATAAARTAPDFAENPEFYRLRDDFTRAYQPVTEEEKLLVTQMVRAWQHLSDLYELRTHLTRGKGLIDLFHEDPDTYQRLTRDLSSAEPMWRNALLDFNRARRGRRASATPAAEATASSPRSALLLHLPPMNPPPEAMTRPAPPAPNHAAHPRRQAAKKILTLP